ncbi:proteasome subunit beta [Candidatus Woesearchaeota archaeon]|nr:proteasome subunit beta [Candidatus Woesearchaeota archaeon]
MVDEHKLHKTGTTTVGVVCKDGVVLGADRKITMGGQIVSNKKFEKVIILTDDFAITVAGLLSDIQLLTKLFKAQMKLDELRKNKKVNTKEAANMLANLVYSNVRKFSTIEGITGFLFGGRDISGFHLYEIGMDGALSKFDDYTADGSGMFFATGVLEAGYKENMSVDDGIKLVVSALNAAIQRDTASGAGCDVITITKEGTKKAFFKQLDTKLTM